MPGTRPKTEKEIILQRVTAMERLAKMGAAPYTTPTNAEIDAWVAEVKEFIKAK